MFDARLQQGYSLKNPLHLHYRGYHLISNWLNDLMDYWPRIVLALAILLIFYYLGKFFRQLTRGLVKRFFKRNKNPEIVELLSMLLYAFFLFSGISLALDTLEMGDTLTRLLASAGILGIIAGFAFKDIASNLFAGLLLKYQRPFRADDWISVADHFGRVKHIGWLATSIKMFSGEAVYVPNRLIYERTLTNYTDEGVRLVCLKTGVAYGEDLMRVRDIALEEAAAVKRVLKDRKISFYYTQIGNFAYNFQLQFWISYRMQTDYLEAMSDIIMRIQSRFKREGISIAYPVTTLDFGVKGGRNIFDKPLQLRSVDGVQSPMRSSSVLDSGEA